MTTFAFTGIYIKGGSDWLVGTPMDFPEAFEQSGVDWELFQPTEEDQKIAQKLVEDSVPEGTTVIVKIFPTWAKREAWFDSAQPHGFV